jgi:hypothetical protein
VTSAKGNAPSYDPQLLGGGSVVPYIGSWSGEEVLPTRIVQRPTGGIGYADETLMDRDEWGVLWARTATRIGAGKPQFSKLHPLRQRRAMLRLLCQVCAQPADWTDEGHLWLLPEQPSYEPGWPEDVPVTLPPLCVACAGLSVRMCPALRPTYVAVRAHSRVCGVSGVRFQPGYPFPQLAPEETDEDIFYHEDPAIGWVMATQRARSLHDCVFVDLDRLGS